MLFNSIEFLIFLPLVFVFYWFVFNKNIKYQNLLILTSSYVFYGWWDYRFLSLIFLSTVVDYFVGLSIPKQDSDKKQKLLLWCSVIFNLSVLGFFKYYNFFVDSWIDLFNSLGYEIKSEWTLNIILPVGISFYTFQTMSYTIDVYRKQIKPTKDFISFASFVSFFPQLVAGPIEKSKNFLPQILNKRDFTYEQGVQGLRLILWGMFKKVVIADSLSPKVDDIFSNYTDLGGGTLLLGLVYFSFQIYCDFSGYSDIAIGTSKLFGLELMPNFKFPYFSRNIGEFWRRWHISMTTWFTDYLYVPLKLRFRYSGYLVNLLSLVLYFFIIGLWHGANWNFIVFGLYHSIFFIPTLIYPKFYKLKTKQISSNGIFPSLKEIIQVGSTFVMVTFGWVFFRSESIRDSIRYSYLMTQNITQLTFDISDLKTSLLLLWFLIIEYQERKTSSTNHLLNRRFFFYFIIMIMIISFSSRGEKFIYFNF